MAQLVDRSTDGPVDRSQVWIGSKVIAHDLHGDDLADVLQQNGNASAWAIAPRTASAELHRFGRMLDLDDAVLEGILAPEQRIKFVDLERTRVVRLRAIRLQGREIVGDDLSMIITDQVLIMLVDEPYGSELARLLSGSGHRLAGGSADRAAELVIDHVVGASADAATEIETASDQLADALFGGAPLSRELKLDAFRLRRAVTALRRVTEPTAEVLQDLVEAGDDLDVSDTRRWSMIIDHANRVNGGVAMLGDSLTAIFDTSLSLDNARMDEVMKKLTGWAGIIAVPTLVTGFVGMNVHFWLNDTQLGFYIYLAIMVVAAAILYVIFRRNSWI
ncbi:magnesium transporter CorA family protein [Microlunatus soli]|uniref:magnesium transporter CorA family protein n=1 Tax=Microlunatus soli TaxID=630515 RepID=UPI0012FB2893|nr:CorA family divalent cation transporter [Microlunatus soli]